MKKVILFLLILNSAFCILNSNAQAPQSIPYQAVARNNVGSVIANHIISLRFSIRNATAMGSIVYQETQIATTNSFGLFTSNIGLGTVVSGTFSTINWGVGAKFMQVELDTTGGIAYVDMGTQQMLSVPFALYAGASAESDPKILNATINKVAKWNGTALTDGLIFDDGINIGIGTISPTNKLEVVGNTKTTNFQMSTGAAAGTVLTGDAFGNSTWTPSTSLAITENDPKISSSMLNKVAKWNGTSLTDGLIFDNGMNIGIGTLSPSNKLEVAGNTKTTNFQMSTGAAAGTVLTGDAFGNSTWTPSTSLAITENDPKISSSMLNKVAKWNGTSLTDGLIFDNGSNIGIGTNSPSNKLEVVGNTKTTNFQMTTGAAAGTVLTSDSLGNATWTPSTSLAITEIDPKVACEVFNTIPRWNGGILTNGIMYDTQVNIGIGTSTPNPFFKLDVVGDAQFNLVRIGTGAGNIITNTTVGNSALFYNNIGGFNTAIGGSALYNNFSGNQNTAIGYQSLLSNIGGYENTANGFNALMNNSTGYRNTAIGVNALLGNTGGWENTANGYQSLAANTGGIHNTANGAYSLFTNTAYNNTATGYQSLYSNIGGHSNTATGNDALYFNSFGIENTSYGYQSLYSNRNGNFNTAFGSYAMYNNINGHYNTAIGYHADVDSIFSSLTNATAIGANTLVSSSNSLILGNNANVGIGTSSPIAKLDVVGNIKSTEDATINDLSVGKGGGNIFDNTAIGISAFFNNSYGHENTANGYQALSSNTGGNDNTAVGANAMLSNTIGSFNTIIGAYADVSTGTLTNATAIGANAVASQNNSLILGNNADVGIGTSSPNAKLEVIGNIKTTELQVTSGAVANSVLTGDIFGIATWTPSTSLTITETDPRVGSITINKVPTWDGTSLLDGSIYDNGSKVAIGTSTPVADFDINVPVKIGVNGSVLTNIIRGTSTTFALFINPGVTATQTYTISNTQPGSSVIVSPSGGLTGGVVIAYARVSAINTVEVSYVNTTPAGVILTPGVTLNITVIN